jgi:DNA-binding transcriptional ArsR family regulator
MLMSEGVADDSQVVKIAKALGDPTRFGILRAIAGVAEISCSDIARRFRVSQATVSHHTRILLESGLVAMRREGQFNYFRAAPSRLEWYRRALRRLAGLTARAVVRET